MKPVWDLVWIALGGWLMLTGVQLMVSLADRVWERLTLPLLQTLFRAAMVLA